LIHQETNLKNKIISFEEVDDATLDLNLSVLAERNGTVRNTAVMDHYGIRVFNWNIEVQIRQYEANEQQKIAYYKRRVLSRDRNQEDKELETIRKQVFAVSSVPSKTIEDHSNQGGVWQNAILTTMIIMLMLMVGIFYGRLKKKEREKKLADIDNSYDE